MNSRKKPFGYVPKNFKDIRPVLYLNEWDAKKLHKERLKLGLTQSEVAAVIGVTNVTISHIERGIANNPWAIQMYGIILERYKAYSEGYMPAFRKIGTNTFKERL